MDVDRALHFARQQRNGVLATLERDGRPQMSNITDPVGDGGVIRISITADRAKFANLRRDPRASLHVSQPDFSAYVVIDGDVDVAPVATSPDDRTWRSSSSCTAASRGNAGLDEYRSVMVTDRRTLVRLRPTYAYGMLRN